MKKTIVLLTFVLTSSSVSAESIMKPFNDKGYGIISGRIQSLSMYRDYDDIGNGANSNLALQFGYTSPEISGFDAGMVYINGGEIYTHNKSEILANDDINVFNEGWLRYTFGTRDLSRTSIVVGRKVRNSEVFRADDFRQKARSIEAVQFETGDIPDTRLIVGHATKLSNWIDTGDLWKFNEFNEVFGTPYDSDGVTWAEATFGGLQGLEVALFDAYAWDITNLVGTRVKWDITGHSALVGYYRHENAVGKASTRHTDVFGLSLQQKVATVSVEPGFFSVHGSSMRFQEATTGINHPLGSSMMIYAQQFNGGARTAFLKAGTRIRKTVLYALYNYTWQDNQRFDGQELNIVVKQPIVDSFSLAIKGGIGHRDWHNGNSNTTATDARLFATYTF
ncbi:MAG: hypothetical protein PVG72_13835 [Gammaproteobacteria bacterium]|jgi:hypothetical protein